MAELLSFIIIVSGKNCNEKVVTNGNPPCYTERKQRNKKQERRGRYSGMRQSGFFPAGRLAYMAAAAAAAIAGNALIRLIPWSVWLEQAYMEDSGIGLGAMELQKALLLTLVLAPLFEEALFRWGIFRWLRQRAGFFTAALLSSLAFGLYHGNLIQGLYAFILGMVLAWGYEGNQGCHPYRMAVMMHGLANLSAIAVFGL